MAESEYELPEWFEITILDQDIEASFEPNFTSTEFTLASVIGTLFFYRSGTDPALKENQVDAFENGVEIIATIPPEIHKHPLAEIRGIENLRLAYLDDRLHKWVPFQYQMLDLERNQVIVRFNYWLKDPNVGWGFL